MGNVVMLDVTENRKMEVVLKSYRTVRGQDIFFFSRTWIAMHVWAEKVALRGYRDLCTKPVYHCRVVKCMLGFFLIQNHYDWVAQFRLEFMFSWVFSSSLCQWPWLMVVWTFWTREQCKVFKAYIFLIAKLAISVFLYVRMFIILIVC